ncbi:MAG TPA: hypothetical protein VM577_10015 [Anaerovoracaceae bacterium]|nr:hypothetical protein [Anaerovoracaceae bacterium]
MRLSQLLAAIDKVADDKGISTPYVCGGVPRDRVLKRTNDINDIDLTTGDQGIHYLAKEIAIKFRSNNTSYFVMPDGHARVMLGGLKLDFSSNFRIPGINEILKDKGIADPTEMQMELYSRDFTCNALLMTMDMKQILDPTGLGVKDIQAGIIKTCLDPKITLGFDNKRVARVIYLAAKLGFKVDQEVADWIKENPASIANARPQYLAKKLAKAISYNKERTVALLDEMKLWPYVPPMKSLTPYMIGNIKRL